MNNQHLFHIHTYRCGHAGDENDEAYILKALELGAKKLTFTDHAPFPGNPFGHRMNYDQLDEYISTLSALKEKYREKIEIETGLEIEYLPDYENYYKELSCKKGLQILLMGQHFFQHENGDFSFSDDSETKNKTEFSGCIKAIIQGTKTGYFDYVAHPDRCFRRCKKWTAQMEELSAQLIQTAAESEIPLEFNMSSYKEKSSHYWWQEFWQTVDVYNSTHQQKVSIIYGLDAHSTTEMESAFLEYLSLIQQK